MGTSIHVVAIADLTVLVVDHEHGSRKLIRSLLLALGCTRIHEACDGGAGLAAIRSRRPDVVLLEWGLPDMGGTEFVRAMCAPDRGPSPKAAVVTLIRADRGADVLEAVRLGIHEFLLKPIVRDALEARLLSVLAHRRSAAWPPSEARIAAA